jgi:predicted ATPase
MTSQALDYITVKGFKSIASIDQLALRPINVLIGANGAGKSNFIGTFSFLRAITEGRLQTYVRESGGADQILHFGAKTTKQIEIRISFAGGVNRYLLILGQTQDDSLFPEREIATFSGDKVVGMPVGLTPRDNGLEAGISDPTLGVGNIPGWVRHRLGLWRVYHVHDTSSTSPMRKTAKLNDNNFLRADGSNLPSFLYLLQRRYRDTYELIRRTVQRVTPFFDDFTLTPDPLNEEAIRLAWRHKNSDQYFGASALSDGSLRFIVLATLFLQPVMLRPSVILVDEPELGLHPSAIALLAALVKQASVETQVILSTQSALLLDHFQPEDILVAERDGGSTGIRRLDAARLESWLEDYSLGELWEKNELGGRPMAE